MKRHTTVIGLLVLVALASGCASNIERAYTTRVVFNNALEDLMAAKQNQVINDDAYRTCLNLAQVVSPALDELDRSAAAGETFGFWNVYRATRAKLAEFLLNLATAKQNAKTVSPPETT